CPDYHRQDGGFAHRSCGKQASCPKALDAFETEPHEKHSLGSVAQAVSGNSRHLGRLFQQELDIPPRPWMESMRLHSTQDIPFIRYSATAATQHSDFGNHENPRRFFERRFPLKHRTEDSRRYYCAFNLKACPVTGTLKFAWYHIGFPSGMPPKYKIYLFLLQS